MKTHDQRNAFVRLPACGLPFQHADGTVVSPHTDASGRPSLTHFLPGHSWDAPSDKTQTL